MTLSELISIEGLQDSFELSDAALLLHRLIADEPTGSDLERLDAILSAYQCDDPEALEALGRVLASLARADGEGDGFLISGPPGAGKSHLLGTILLLAGSDAARKRLARRKTDYADDLRVLHESAPMLVVPVPLEEHGGRDELLEDIIFERTERELRRPPHEIGVPLSQHSYALELIQRHVAPRFEDELAQYIAERSHRETTWEELVERDEETAVRIAHQFAGSINYPLDFRQSRVERMARLLELVDGERLSGVIYLLDDLGDFLSSVDDKAMQGDLVFLEFLAHRGRIAPLWTVAALEMPLREIPGIEASLARRISDLYRGGPGLSSEHVRWVVADAVRPAEGAACGEALEEMVQAHERVFGQTQEAEELVRSFPLHPQAMEVAEELARRVLGRADGVLTVLRYADESGLLEERTHLQPLSLNEGFDALLPQLRSNPDAAPYLGHALEYYEAHAAEVHPRNPELLRRVIRALIAFRLANLWPQESELREALGTEPDGAAVAEVDELHEAVEAARNHGRFVEVRRGREESDDVYYVEVHTPLKDALRERLTLARERVARDDPQLIQAAIAHAGASVPLEHLAEEDVLLEVHWRNTARVISASVGRVQTLDELDLDRRVQEMADPASIASAHLHVATMLSADQQRRRWSEITEGTLAGRWSASIMCWIPRALHERERDTLRDCAACRMLLADRITLEREQGLVQRLEEEEARLGAEVREIVRNAYYEGAVLAPFGEAISAAELADMKGDWSSALNAIAGWALDRVFPGFATIAPKQFLSERKQIDLLVDEFIRPGHAEPDPDSRLTTLIEAFLIPLGVARRDNDAYRLDITRSVAADEVMQRIRARDQTPETRRGRPLACPDLAEHLLKSELGLPPELFELLIAALIRRGYLMALDADDGPVQLSEIPTPISRHLQKVARPALLSYEQWQLLSRVCRTVFDQSIAHPDHGAQAVVWEAFVGARSEWLERIEELREGIADLRERLDQSAEAWRESLAALTHIERFFSLIDPKHYPAEGLAALLEGAEPFLESTNGVSKLRDLLRVVDLLEHFVDQVGPQLVNLRSYLIDEDLRVPEDSDLSELRERLMEVLRVGEKAVGEEQTIVRLTQVFFARYKRHYSAWHNSAHRASEFEPYNTVRASPEMRVLAALDRLDFDVQHDLRSVNDQIEREVAKRCREMNLSQALERSPVCPGCGLRLGEELNLRPPGEIQELAARGVAEYVDRLRAPDYQRALAEYIQSLPHRGETVRKLAQIVRMPEDMGARSLMPLLGDDVITHMQRAFSGQQVRSRSLGELRRNLAGRTLSRDEVLKITRDWLDAEQDLDEDDLLHIEP